MAARFELRAVRGHFDAELLKGHGGVCDILTDRAVLEYRGGVGQPCEAGLRIVLRDRAEQVYDLAGRGLRDGRCCRLLCWCSGDCLRYGACCLLCGRLRLAYRLLYWLRCGEGAVLRHLLQDGLPCTVRYSLGRLHLWLDLFHLLGYGLRLRFRSCGRLASDRRRLGLHYLR